MLRLREAWGAVWNDFSGTEKALIEGGAGASPYLRGLMRQDPALVADLFNHPPAVFVERLCKSVALAGESSDYDASLGLLRSAKKKAALSIALADLAGAIDEMAVARLLSNFADACVNAALKISAKKYGLDKETDGLCVIAMGKLGAQELNYSSDIDLVIIYDASKMGIGDRHAAKDAAVRVAKDTVAALQNQTADGYVFRTDLRLRPDPGVSALAVSAAAAETYYESYGQNWERMAYIKARANAGDCELGTDFLHALRPFVWRKYLDFAAIEDVVAVKRQIQSAKGGSEIEFAGQDIKLGRGGIREVEFFAQTQQVILGGRNENLRVRSTTAALSALHAAGAITDAQLTDMTEAYGFLRRTEHRLQMINDEQTHKLPTDEKDIERLAVFAGEDSVSQLRERLTTTLKTVRRHYDDLFHDETTEIEQPGPLVFTGVESDSATIETLSAMGFRRPKEISRAIRRWHAGSIRATRSERARNILTSLMAPLLTALSKSNDPDAAFFAFGDFLERLPAGVQVFALLANNIKLFDSLISLMVISPFLGREMSKRVNYVESLLENGPDAPPPELSTYNHDLKSVLSDVESYESALNAVRRWAGEAKFAIAARLAAGVGKADEAAAHFSAIADACIQELTPRAENELAAGAPPAGGGLAVLALGRLGAQEMTAASDIDLMFIYDVGAIQPDSSGILVDTTSYYTRLVRRIVTALSVSTEEGALYDVDMQLRPSGGAGPAAVSFSAFQEYYRRDAWIWECMALSRARVVAGPDALCQRIEQEIDEILRRPRDRKTTADAVNQMRARLLRVKPAAGVWDVKNMLGGLTDVAFIAQFLILTTDYDVDRAPLQTRAALSWLARNEAIDQAAAERLSCAHRIYDSILHMARAGTGGVFIPEESGEALSGRMASLCGADDLGEAEKKLRNLYEKVAQDYQQVLGRLPQANE